MSGPGSDKIWNNAFICIHKQSHNLQLKNSLALPESNVDISNYDKSLLYWWLVEMVLLVALSVTIMSDSLQTSQLCRHQQVWVLGPCINCEGFLQPTLWACNISIQKKMQEDTLYRETNTNDILRCFDTVAIHFGWFWHQEYLTCSL